MDESVANERLDQWSQLEQEERTRSNCEQAKAGLLASIFHASCQQGFLFCVLVELSKSAAACCLPSSRMQRCSKETRTRLRTKERVRKMNATPSREEQEKKSLENRGFGGRLDSFPHRRHYITLLGLRRHCFPCPLSKSFHSTVEQLQLFKVGWAFLNSGQKVTAHRADTAFTPIYDARIDEVEDACHTAKQLFAIIACSSVQRITGSVELSQCSAFQHVELKLLTYFFGRSANMVLHCMVFLQISKPGVAKMVDIDPLKSIKAYGSNGDRI
ncbi:hypothetical protein T05_5761 [Trichinella murrelli]|uniref:Uncharacterized protein n=1 Tax=Trichinella murrelli TaxID=144512 RepID=A0A0V0TLD9_9BILA|nr:hypothetical protein T05_5761 [Trichinella murrelli]